jgi:hypothetical protein
MFAQITRSLFLITLLCQVPISLMGISPTDNPVASHYSGDAGYPAWTDHIRWDQVIDMSTYGNPGDSEFTKFEAARDELHAMGGGVLYYPAGIYDFSDAPMDGPTGRGLMLKSGVVIRGETPAGDADAADGSLTLGTRFDFGFTARTGTSVTPDGETPRDWNLIGLQPDTGSGETLSDVNNVGIVHVHLVGASVFWGFELDWDGTTTYAVSGAWKSGLVKAAWQGRVANGQFPLDYFAGSGGSRSYVGAGTGRLVFGCILQDSAPVNNVYREGRADPNNFGDSGYWLQKFAARIQVYGSRVCIANNLLPKSTRGFLYQQTVGDNPTQSTNPSSWTNITATVYYNYNYVTGIDLNKELLNPYLNKNAGYFEDHAIVRDNWIYNHGRKGYNLSGEWVEIRNNTNQRDFLSTTVPSGSGPASGQSYYLTLDGYVQLKPGGPGDISDSLSRALDLAGGPLWIHENKYGGSYGSTDSIGNDGEGILCQAHGGTHLVSWAITYNSGQDGYMAGYDVTHSGSLWGWNTTVGETGNKKAGTMYDSAIVNNSGGSIGVTGSEPVLTSNPGDPVNAPTGLTATVVGDHVEIAWTDTSTKETGFRVERSVDGGPWSVIAYRPRREAAVSGNPAAWHDISAPRGLELRYRVRPTNWTDDSTVVSAETAPVSLPVLASTRVAVSPDTLPPQDPLWETGYQDRLGVLANAQSPWSIRSGNADPDDGKRVFTALMAEMWKVRDNEAALLNFINNQGVTGSHSSWAGSFYKPFSVPPLTHYYKTFEDIIPQAEKDYIRNRVNSSGWDYMTRFDGYMDPLYQPSLFNSENFNWMARLGGYLWSLEFDDVDLGPRKGMARSYFKDHLDNLTRALFNTGRVEWNSNNYWGHSFNPILTLYEFAPDARTRNQARALADWMVLEAALHYIDGFQAGADVRAKTNAFLPFAGGVWPFTYLYFIDDSYHPTYSTTAVQNAIKVDYVGLVHWSSYRPPQVAIDIAQRKFSLPVEIQSAKPFYYLDHDNYQDWSGETDKSRRFEFETLYLNDNYVLSSLATNRPDRNASIPTQSGFFTEQSLWRLGVKGSANGALQITGNSGSFSNAAGRHPYEQIGQYRNVMMRVVKGSDQLWLAAPDERPSETAAGNLLFIDMGNGVYVALLPWNTTGYSNEAYSTSGYTRHEWDFNSSAFGGLVMEVGTEREYGSYAGFKNSIQTYSVLQSPVADQLSYSSPLGHELRLEFQPVTTMLLNPGQVDQNGNPLPQRNWTPAGTLPRTWRDGVEVDYDSWNAYEVVQGEEIVHQEWGSGLLRMAAGGEVVEIEVDPVTAEVTYYEVIPGPEVPPWQDWQTLHFSPSEISAGLAGPGMDAELVPDGIPNLLEYAFGMDPLTHDAHLAGPLSGMVEDGGTLYLSIVIRRNPDATDVTYSVETMRSPETDWLTEAPADAGPAGTDVDGMPLYEYQVPVGGGTVLCRVRVE